ncbi:DUF2827 domain-containing protein [Hydromonas duriensis]|uniref:Uncharacterized protein DUF2827 n=1 Tax=Hydromonas duriensis TaxID=1527608 RepID=A0A4R6Y384_9BURK|nr:DUF2827 domain-containing protein [Hydromonas duriensis]TDR31006.1 uncharacterized protein DUF2827 [Hydromonas duriensis]
MYTQTSNPQNLRIGVTIGLREPNESLWNNGIKQNAVFLTEALKHCPSVQSVCLVNATDVLISEQLPWDLDRWPTKSFDDAKDDLDILIELGGQISSEQTEYIKSRGTRLISYCCTVEYVLAMESVLFGRPLWGSNLFINQRYDAVWMIPQVANISQSYFSTLRRREACVIPFVWDPVFIEARSASLTHHGEYRPRPNRGKRLSVMEPNHDVVKFCFYPTLIAEEAYRLRPDAIEILQVTNAEYLAHNSKEFVALMLKLDIVQQHKAVFLGRYETPLFLSEATDVVISHQWDNPLNYFYFDVCWQGYPLVHNAHMCPDLGYYYEGNNAAVGAQALLRAFDEHDNNWQDYIQKQRSIISRYLPGHPDITRQYNDLLKQVMSQPII